jgi:hypothetical protein
MQDSYNLYKIAFNTRLVLSSQLSTSNLTTFSLITEQKLV